MTSRTKTSARPKVAGLTPARRRALDILSEANRPVGAYEMIDLMVDDWVVEKVVRLIVVSTAAGCPGGISDAKIMLVPVQDCSPTAGGRPATPTNRIGALCSA